MSKEGIVYLLMILNVNTYVNVILERSLRANEGHIGVNESLLMSYIVSKKKKKERKNQGTETIVRHARLK